MLALKENIDFTKTAYLVINGSTDVIYWNNRFTFDLPGSVVHGEPWQDESTDILCPLYATRGPGYSQTHLGEDLIIYASSTTTQCWVQDDSCQGSVSAFKKKLKGVPIAYHLAS